MRETEPGPPVRPIVTQYAEPDIADLDTGVRPV